MPQKTSADYGIDAPGVRRGMFALGVGGVLALLLSATALGDAGSHPITTGMAVAISTITAVYGLGMSAYMTYGSKVGKRRTRERLLDLAQQIMPWTGRETVLDIGCGRGREGVAERVRIETGDARDLPFADGAFDVVLSHWVVHNLSSVENREQAIGEMLRVLRPGGTLVLADIAHHEIYRKILIAAGLTALAEDTGGVSALIIGVLSGGSFRPRALVGLKPD